MIRRSFYLDLRFDLLHIAFHDIHKSYLLFLTIIHLVSCVNPQQQNLKRTYIFKLTCLLNSTCLLLRLPQSIGLLVASSFFLSTSLFVFYSGLLSIMLGFTSPSCFLIHMFLIRSSALLASLSALNIPLHLVLSVFSHRSLPSSNFFTYPFLQEPLRHTCSLKTVLSHVGLAFCCSAYYLPLFECLIVTLILLCFILSRTYLSIFARLKFLFSSCLT